MPNSNRPAKRVIFSPSDTREIIPQGGGGGKFFKPVTSEFKDELISQIDDYVDILSAQNTNIGLMIVELESDALAKSHRPDAVFDEDTCPFIGDIGVESDTKRGRFLIRTTRSGLSSIKYKIQNTNAEYYDKALSTIHNLKPFEPEVNIDRLSNEYEVLVKLIDFKSEAYNEQKLSKYDSLVSQENIESREINNSGIFHVRATNQRISSFLLSLKENNILLSARTAKYINFRPLQLLPEGTEIELPSAIDGENYPVVGVVDTCIKGDCPDISSWYTGGITSIIEEDRVYDHGTFVAGLITNSYALNSRDHDFPKSQSKVYSVGVLSSEGANLHEIYDMLVRAQNEKPNIKVWNLSLGASEPVELTRISEFAIMLDKFQKENNCICIIAAGNIEQYNILRKWPPQIHEPIPEQRISSPGDSVLGVTVASVAQVDGIVNRFEPSIFSRSGPVANYILKPDLCHFGGNHIKNGPALTNLGITSLGMTSQARCAYGQDCGTSFATPLVSTVAANLWQHVGTDTPRHTVKGLLAHSARLRQEIDKDEKVYYGWGMPLDIDDYMYCNENEITIILEGEISSNREIVGKLPFPIPSSMRTSTGKVKGEFFMTVSYDPPLDTNRAFEYCLVNIDAGLGEVDINGNFTGKIPAEGTGLEQDLVNGKYKWSPIKISHKKFSRGVDVENWKLQVKMLTRHGFKPDENFVQPFTIILTIRSLDPNAQVYNEMVRLMDDYNWEVQNANISIEQIVQV